MTFAPPSKRQPSRRRLDRRAFLGSNAALAAGLILPGCATTPTPTQTPAPTCLPKLNIDRSRMIRAVAGLRPYRAEGFVVREDALGTKRVIHNYGHGGAGITLSWGTSYLAARLGLPGHSGSVAVLGAGIMGLTTARLVQEAGLPVTIYAAALPPHTTSNVAGGQFHPFGHFREDRVTPEWREQYRQAVDYSWRRFQLLVGDDYGVRWLPTYAEKEAPETPILSTFPPVNRSLQPHEHPFPVDNLIRYDTLYVEVGRYLRQLLREVRADGGQVRIQRIGDREAVAALPERLVFNCTGLGSRELFGDTVLMPIRGQLAVMLPQPEIQYAYMLDAGYMFPRPDGIVIGGTYERGEEIAEPQPERIDQIIASHAELMRAWRCKP
jgi:glycine/D-amino acid oxidase-like deaminating enzyme